MKIGPSCPNFPVLFPRISIIYTHFFDISPIFSGYLIISQFFITFVHSVNAIILPSWVWTVHHSADWKRFRNKNLGQNICFAVFLINSKHYPAFYAHKALHFALIFVPLDFIKLKQLVQIAHILDFTRVFKNFFTS